MPDHTKLNHPALGITLTLSNQRLADHVFVEHVASVPDLGTPIPIYFLNTPIPIPVLGTPIPILVFGTPIPIYVLGTPIPILVLGTLIPIPVLGTPIPIYVLGTLIPAYVLSTSIALPRYSNPSHAYLGTPIPSLSLTAVLQ